MFDLIKRQVTFEGMDCYTDQLLPQYTKAGSMSQMEVSWMSSGKYAKYTVYYGVATIFIGFIKHGYYLYIDKYDLIGFMSVLLSYCRFIGYKQINRKLAYYTSLPNSVGYCLYYFLTSVYLLCYCLVPHFWYRGCLGFGSPPLGIRAGVMATALTPFIYVLAGKSNMITLLTGISYEKLNSIHQYVGVASFILSIIHTIPFIHQSLVDGGSKYLSENFKTFNYYSGIPPLILLGWLCIMSKSWFRKHMYEIFLHCHWIVGIGYFATLWWHIDNLLDMTDYMYGALAFWATQIIYRILIKTTFRPNQMFMKSRNAELIKINDTTFLINVLNTKGLSWKPGQHVFLRFKDKKILDSHPFSISSTKQLKFIIVQKNGLTKTISQQLDDYLKHEKQVYIDGPYGGVARDPLSFNRMILLCTGSGITATIPFLLQVSNAIESNQKITTSSISLTWIIRHISDLSWFESELTECKTILGDLLDINIYIVHPQDQEKHVDNHNLEKLLPLININYHKPSITRLIESFTPTLLKKNIFVSSGSDSMRYDVSNAVSKLQPMVFNNDYHQTGIEEIYLHSEAFSW